MKVLLMAWLLLVCLTPSSAQGRQAQANVSLTVQRYLNVRFDGGQGGEHDLLLILASPGKRAFRLRHAFTASANAPFVVESHLFAVVPQDRYWTVDVDDALDGAQRTLTSPAGIARSTLTVTVQVPHGGTPVVGAVLLTIAPQ